MRTERCTRCGAIKPLDAFHSNGAGGRKARCIECRLAGVRAQRAARPERHILSIMVQRCHNPRHHRYPLYGARGIAVCDRWRESFEDFLADVGPRPSPKHSIDRIDNDRGYEPGNVRWATQREQMRNTRGNRLLSARGKTQCLAAWEEETGITGSTIAQRVDVLGWSPSDAVAVPSGTAHAAMITARGRTMRRAAWARETGVPALVIRDRMRAGWPADDAVFTPHKKKRDAA